MTHLRASNREPRPDLLSGPGNPGESGYTLVVLAIAITVLSILIAMALPSWSTIMKREREAELIFRGLQYAEAIRIFQARFGRAPTKLEELVKVQPRSIRQLYSDPMSKDGEWALLFQTGREVGGGARGVDDEGRLRVRPSNGRQASGQQASACGNGRQPSRPSRNVAVPGSRRPGDGKQVTIGPINGVKSKSTDEALRSFFGKSNYNQWEFTPQLLIAQMTGGQVGAGANPNLPPATNIRWLGKPFPADVLLPGGAQGQGTGVGGTPVAPASGSAPGNATEPIRNTDGPKSQGR